MTYLIDTSIVSEVRKGEGCDPGVSIWYESVDESELYLSALTVGEIQHGIENIRLHDPTKAAALESWVALLESGFNDRILPVDSKVAAAWGRLMSAKQMSVVGAMLAATAKVNGLVLVSAHEQETDAIEYLNPLATERLKRSKG